jgi:hypothetical protein
MSTVATNATHVPTERRSEMPHIVEVYEAPNTYTPNLPLDEQIEQGCNDWIAVCSDGSEHFGHTEVEATQEARRWCGEEE